MATFLEINKPCLFDRMWFSHKFHGPGLRYGIALAVHTGDIAWFNGPYPCGSFPGITIYCLHLKQQLGPGECVIANRGNKEEETVHNPDANKPRQYKRYMYKAQAQHETVNWRRKCW